MPGSTYRSPGPLSPESELPELESDSDDEDDMLVRAPDIVRAL